MAQYVSDGNINRSDFFLQIYKPGGSLDRNGNGNLVLTSAGTDHYAKFYPSDGYYNGEILTRFRYSLDNDGMTGVVAFRFAGSSQATANGYMISLLRDGLTPGFVVYDNARGTVPGSPLPFNHRQNTWYWVRVNWRDSTIKYKVWEDNAPEPSGWSRVVNSSTVPAAPGQSAGVYSFNSSTVEYNFWGYDTYGGTVMPQAVKSRSIDDGGKYVAAPFGGSPFGGLMAHTGTAPAISLEVSTQTLRLTLSRAALAHTPPIHAITPKKFWPRIIIGKAGLSYSAPTPGQLQTAGLAARLIVSRPTLSHTGPTYALKPSKITERVNISSPALTAYTAALIQPEGVNLRVGISSPSVIFIPKPEVLELRPSPVLARLTITRTNNLLDPSVYNIEYKQYRPDYVGIKAYEGETLNIDRYRPDTIETGKIDSIELNTYTYKQIVIK